MGSLIDLPAVRLGGGRTVPRRTSPHWFAFRAACQAAGHPDPGAGGPAVPQASATWLPPRLRL